LIPERVSRTLPLLLILGWLAVLVSVMTVGWTNTWKALGVPTMFPPFADMRTVQGSLISIELGFNPQLKNVGDPWMRVMNYPSIWSLLAAILNLQNETSYLILICTWIVLFVLCCYLLLRNSPSIILLLLCFSGSALLAVERGNNDLLVFVLLFLSASSNKMLGAVSVILATLLKIYPLLVIPAFLKNLKTTIAMTAGVGLMIFLLWSELSSIRSATPISAGLSYGSLSIAAAAQKYLNITVPSTVYSLIFLVISLVIVTTQKTRELLATINLGSNEETLFLVGSCVYIGTFILSSNWDYRLIFLLFCAPLVLKLELKILRYCLLAALLIAMNQQPMGAMFGKFGYAINILSKTFLLIVLCSITLLKLYQILEHKGLISKK
jgi:hypothetical protein